MSNLESQNYYWWKQPDDQLYKSVSQYMKYLNTEQSYRQSDNVKHMRLYGNLELLSLRTFQFIRSENSAASQARVTLNIVQSMIDTVVSKLTKSTPKPTFLTAGGDWTIQRKAKKLTKFVEGQYDATKFYAKRAQAIMDSCIFGTGGLKFFKKDGEIHIERIFIDEIVIDDREAVYGEPRQMHQKKYIHKDVLKEMFPKYAVQIEAAGSGEASQYATNSFDRSTNMLLVVESWHLKSGPNADDGKHAITINTKTLFSESYEKNYFPFVFWRWGLRPLGFFGQGLSEQLSGLQLEINKILRTIQVSMHLVSIPKLLVEASSKVVSAHLNNKIGGIIKYAGTAPQYAPLGGIPTELFSHLDRLYQRAYEIAGISQLSANAQKPAGLDSGKALREYNDIESERFMSVGKRDEEAVMEASKILVDIAKDLDEELKDEGGYKVKIKNRKNLDIIKWSEVDLDEDKYIMQVFPTSALSTSPAGRLQDVQELLQAGFIGKEDGMKLLDFPDLEQFYNFNNAGLEDIERAIECIIDKGQYETPEPYQNLQLGITKMQQAYLLYRADGAPDDRLDLFRRWIEDAAQLLQKAQQPQLAPGVPTEGIATPAAPIAQPEAQPTSDLLPVTGQ